MHSIPKLILKDMVESIIDLAAEAGGNCEYTIPHEKYVHSNGVKVNDQHYLLIGAPAFSTFFMETGTSKHVSR